MWALWTELHFAIRYNFWLRLGTTYGPLVSLCIWVFSRMSRELKFLIAKWSPTVRRMDHRRRPEPQGDERPRLISEMTQMSNDSLRLSMHVAHCAVCDRGHRGGSGGVVVASSSITSFRPIFHPALSHFVCVRWLCIHKPTKQSLWLGNCRACPSQIIPQTNEL